MVSSKVFVVVNIYTDNLVNVFREKKMALSIARKLEKQLGGIYAVLEATLTDKIVK